MLITDFNNIQAGDQNLKTLIDLLNPLGEIKSFPTFKDRSAEGLTPLAFDNGISQTTYADYFAEIGHMFNAQHVEAGDADLSGSSTEFYPTPVPGKYGRSGIPSLNFDETYTVDETDDYIEGFPLWINSNRRNGTKYKYEVISGASIGGLTSGDSYHIRFTGTPGRIAFFNSEDGAIDNTGRIELTASVGGTFRLTQEGIAIDDAGQRITGSAGWGAGVALLANNSEINGALTIGDTVRSNRTDVETGTGYDLKFDSALSPDARTSNETRGTTFYEFGYIRIKSILE